MIWKSKDPLGRFSLSESIEIDAAVGRVFAHWSRYEDFPHFMESVRRTKCIDEHRVLWDIDIAGRQVVLEARIVESIAEKRIRWESARGTPSVGTVRFEELPDAGTRITVEIEYLPLGFLETLGARCGLVDLHVRRDLARFRRFVESLPQETGHQSEDSSPESSRPCLTCGRAPGRFVSPR